MTINPPADFTLYVARLNLMAKHRAEVDQTKRDLINALIEMMDTRDEALREGDAGRLELANTNILKHTLLMEATF